MRACATYIWLFGVFAQLGFKWYFLFSFLFEVFLVWMFMKVLPFLKPMYLTHCLTALITRWQELMGRLHSCIIMTFVAVILSVGYLCVKRQISLMQILLQLEKVPGCCSMTSTRKMYNYFILKSPHCTCSAFTLLTIKCIAFHHWTMCKLYWNTIYFSLSK